MCEFMLVAGRENASVCSAAFVCVGVLGCKEKKEGRVGVVREETNVPVMLWKE